MSRRLAAAFGALGVAAIALHLLAYLLPGGSEVWLTSVALAVSAGAGIALFARAWAMSHSYTTALRRERSARARLEYTNRELDAFSSSASHDLKAPLVSIQGFAASLRRRSGDLLDERSSLYLDRIESNALDLRRLVDEMLAFARLEAEAAWDELIDADAIARDVVRTFHERYGSSGYAVELLSQLPTIRAHPTRFRQALTNLIENALNHSGGSHPVHVQIMSIMRADTVEIAVQDNGAGVDAVDRERIFRTFTRGERADEGNPGGTGLGLALVKKMADASGGSIRYEPVPQGGARFVLSLPKGLVP